MTLRTLTNEELVARLRVAQSLEWIEISCEISARLTDGRSLLVVNPKPRYRSNPSEADLPSNSAKGSDE